MKKLKVLTDQCIGCGACVGIDPEHFDFNEDGLSKVINEENLESESLQEAIEYCPVGIISIENTEEDDSETQNNSSENSCNETQNKTFEDSYNETQNKTSENSFEEQVNIHP